MKKVSQIAPATWLGAVVALIASFLTPLFMPATPASAAPITVNCAGAGVVFDGDTDDKWNDPSNWDGNALPISSDDVCIPGGFDVVIDTQAANAGALRVADGATLQVDGQTLTVSNESHLDQIEIVNNATYDISDEVEINNLDFKSGTISTPGIAGVTLFESGVFSTASTKTIDVPNFGTQGPVTWSDGDIDATNTHIYIASDWSITADADTIDAGVFDIFATHTVTKSGAGSLTLNAVALPLPGTLEFTGSGTFDVNVSGGSFSTASTGAVSASGTGTLDIVSGNFANNGTIAINGSNTVTFDGVITNFGTTSIDGSGVLQLATGNDFEQVGVLDIADGELALDTGAQFVQSGASTTTMSSSNSVITAPQIIKSGAGTFRANGTLNGDVSVTAGDFQTDTVGTLVINGDLAQSGGTHHVKLDATGTSGTDYDLFDIQDAWTLSGTAVLSIHLNSGTPPDGYEFTVVDTDNGPLTGTFSSIIDNSGAYDFTPSYSGGQLKLTASALGSISGTVINSLDGDSTAEAGEPPAAGVTVFAEVQSGANGVVDNGEVPTTTAADGAYAISNLPPETYLINVVAPSGGTSTSPSPSTVTGSALSGRDGVVTYGGSISGRAYADLNGNTSYDAGEEISGATIGIDRNGDASVEDVTTGSDGTYNIASVPAGSHTVTRSVTGGAFSPASSAIVVSTAANTGNNFVATFGATISGTVFDDIDGNGQADIGENGVSGVTVFIDSNNNGSIDANELVTDETDNNGVYTLTNVSPGSRDVDVIVPAGSTQTGSELNAVVVAPNATVTGQDLFVQQPQAGTISGTVYNDVNGNSVKDSGDTGVENVIVFVDLNNDGVQDNNETNSTTTSSNGTYTLSNAGPGLVHVALVNSAGTTVTQAIGTVNVSPQTGVTGKDAGLFTNGTLSVTVFADNNRNGVAEGGEAFLEGFTVFNDADNDGVVDSGEATVDTNANGKATFSNLASGNYRLRVELFTGVTQTTAPLDVVALTSAQNSSRLVGVAFSSLDPVTQNTGFLMIGADGNVFTFGDAQDFGSPADLPSLNALITDLAPTTTGGGYWAVASDGGVFAYGDAGFFGSAGNIKLNAPIEGIVPTPSSEGYWLVASDGGVFAYGDAAFYGSAGGIKLNSPVQAIVPTPSGEGYWLVASDGGVFSYGDARFHGSLGSQALNAPIVSIAAAPDGLGYWLVGEDGGVFAFGSAKYIGSMGGQKINAPIVNIRNTADGHGYWLIARDGGVFAFGNANFFGTPNEPVSNVVS